MEITRHKETAIPDWYMARMSFKTKYGTIATAHGYGNSFAKALIECLHDYQLVISL